LFLVLINIQFFALGSLCFVLVPAKLIHIKIDYCNM
jgi:hypothetical protein